jgi:hypothetical protein
MMMMRRRRRRTTTTTTRRETMKEVMMKVLRMKILDTGTVSGHATTVRIFNPC